MVHITKLCYHLSPCSQSQLQTYLLKARLCELPISTSTRPSFQPRKGKESSWHFHFHPEGHDGMERMETQSCSTRKSLQALRGTLLHQAQGSPQLHRCLAIAVRLRRDSFHSPIHHCSTRWKKKHIPSHCLRTWCKFSYLVYCWESSRAGIHCVVLRDYKYLLRKLPWGECCHWRFLEKIRGQICLFQVRLQTIQTLIDIRHSHQSWWSSGGSRLLDHLHTSDRCRRTGEVMNYGWQSRSRSFITPLEVSWFEIAVRLQRQALLGVPPFLRGDRSAEEGDDGSSSSDGRGGEFHGASSSFVDVDDRVNYLCLCLLLCCYVCCLLCLLKRPGVTRFWSESESKFFAEFGKSTRQLLRTDVAGYVWADCHINTPLQELWRAWLLRCCCVWKCLAPFEA